MTPDDAAARVAHGYTDPVDPTEPRDCRNCGGEIGMHYPSCWTPTPDAAEAARRNAAQRYHRLHAEPGCGQCGPMRDAYMDGWFAARQEASR